MAVFLLGGCAGPADVEHREESYSVPAPEAPLVADILPSWKPADLKNTNYALLKDGIDAFAARAIMSRHAQSTIDAQYYFVREDLSGTLFKALLLEAANRGVRVRLLIDDMYLHGKEERLSSLAQHPNINIRGFNPFYRGGCCRTLQFLTRFGEVTRRMHNKSFTVDSTATLVGGRNIGDEYFGADEELVFDDLDILALGPVVKEVSDAFDAYWNHELAIPIEDLAKRTIDQQEAYEYQVSILRTLEESSDSNYISALAGSNFVREIRNGDIHTDSSVTRLVVDEPDKLLLDRDAAARYFLTELGSKIAQATKSLTIVSPYFVPGKKGTQQLAALARKGVEVRVITNSMASNNSALVHAHYAKRRKALLRSGVELFEVKPLFQGATDASSTAFLLNPQINLVLHTKAFIFDRNTVFIGSFNFDPRSLYENTEMGVLVESPALAERIEDFVDAELAMGTTYRLQLVSRQGGGEAVRWKTLSGKDLYVYPHEPGIGFFRRLGNRILGWLPVESQL